MAELRPERFIEFFRALYGYDPFPWQQTLAKRVLTTDGPWPQAIALPTAAGKTACIDIAVYALAAQASRLPEERTAPRRIYFVVDRRVIVDAAYERARKLAKALNQGPSGILREVAGRLLSLCGDTPLPHDRCPLAAFQLRGGVYREEAWTRSPTQPTVIASTVDQLGSRLLFRGYGRSWKAWPILAGLAGNDSLFLLDEAHCAQPFMETLKAVARYRTWAERPLPSPFHVTILSATPPAGVGDTFRETEADWNHQILGSRLTATKPVILRVSEKAKGKNAEVQLARQLATQAKGLLSSDRQAIAILVNRVATAKAAFKELEGDEGHDAVLLTGRMRPLDRDDILRRWQACLETSGAIARNLVRPIFVVATQTLEVGADMDFDGMVSECASLDALRQRFGRLNRGGRPIQARGVVVVRADQEKNSDGDPVYGAALARTWQVLRRSVEGDASAVDFGVRASQQWISKLEVSELTAPTSHAPVLFPAHVDILAQTAPVPKPSPDPALFLHGPQAGPADIQVCWRADLDPAQFADDQERDRAWLDTLAYCPPTSAECMPVPLGHFRAWLRLSDKLDVESILTDVEGAPEEGLEEFAEGTGRAVIRWRGRSKDDTIITDRPNEIVQGDVVVIPAQYRGWEEFGHVPWLSAGDSGRIDIAERAYPLARRKALLRLHPNLIAFWPEGNARENLIALAKSVPPNEALPDDWSERSADLPAQLVAVADDLPEDLSWLSAILRLFASDKQALQRALPHPCGGIILIGRKPVDLTTVGAATFTYAGSFSDEDDAAASGTVRVALADHVRGVSEIARGFAHSVGLPKEVVSDLALAGITHDLGKGDPRFQGLLSGGNLWATGGELLAKSPIMPQGFRAFERARRRSRYPEGGRHELVSVRLLESSSEWLARAHDRDLVLHLIASHHGRCRPFAPVIEDQAPVAVKLTLDGQRFEANSDTGLERIDSGVAERYWRLIRRYGWWGLALLEAILRLADHCRSEAEEEKISKQEIDDAA
ncbi:MAG: type I-G CRISPR-associated helicase/endonuclease Cas3g [Acidobacteriota bacterium]